MTTTHWAVAAAVLLGATVASGQQDAPLRDVLQRPAERTSGSARMALIDADRAGQRLIVVGERGYVGWSDDGGKTWRQAVVPVSVTLTAVHFPTDRQGWAVGHGGVVLHTKDRGATWRTQLDGHTIARLVLDAAKVATQAGEAGAPRRLQAAQRLVAEGPDKPLLGVRFLDELHGIVTGAYGIALETRDGGASWTAIGERLDNPKALHLYGVSAHGETVCVAGEQGLVLRSRDRGATFQRLDSPYHGSYFAVDCAAAGEVFAGGLNGNAVAFDADGVGLKSVTEGRASIVAVRRTAREELLVADESGRIWQSVDGGKRLSAAAAYAHGPLASITVLADGSILGIGLRGAALASNSEGTSK